jgi:hypothetical protein
MRKSIGWKGVVITIVMLMVSINIVSNFNRPVYADIIKLQPDSPSKDTIRKQYMDLLQTDNELQQLVQTLSQNDSEQWLTISVGILGVQLLFPPKLPRIFLCPRGFILAIFTWRMEGYTLYTQLDDLINMTVVNGSHGVFLRECYGYSANLRPRIVGAGGGFIAVSTEKPQIIQK